MSFILLYQLVIGSYSYSYRQGHWKAYTIKLQTTIDQTTIDQATIDQESTHLNIQTQ